MNTKLALTLAALGCLTPAHGALLFYEGFDYVDSVAGSSYPNGTNLNTLGTGWSSDTATQPQVQADGSPGSVAWNGTFTGGGYVTTGNILQEGAQDSQIVISQTLSSTVTSTFTAGTVTWLSFLHYNTANETWGLAIGDDKLTTAGLAASGQAVGLGGVYNTGQFASAWDADAAITKTVSANVAQTGRPRLTIAKIEWSDTGDDTISVMTWIEGTIPGSVSETDFNNAGLLKTLSANLSQDSFTTLSFSGVDTAIDEIRIASDFANVIGVPEPSAALLGGLGLLALLRRRRN